MEIGNCLYAFFLFDKYFIKLFHFFVFRELPTGDIEDASLDIFSSEGDDDMVEDESDSDGFLSEVFIGTMVFL